MADSHSDKTVLSRPRRRCEQAVSCALEETVGNGEFAYNESIAPVEKVQ